MRLLKSFVWFWYDFIVGDAWEVAVGVLVTLVMSGASVRLGLGGLAWVVMILGIAISLGLSLAWQARRSGRAP